MTVLSGRELPQMPKVFYWLLFNCSIDTNKRLREGGEPGGFPIFISNHFSR